jgi:transcriptional regulator with XRE-family HTH domain
MTVTSPRKIRAEFRARGWSLTQAANEAGLTRPTVRRMANGKRVTDASALALLSALERSEPVLLRILEATA